MDRKECLFSFDYDEEKEKHAHTYQKTISEYLGVDEKINPHLTYQSILGEGTVRTISSLTFTNNRVFLANVADGMLDTTLYSLPYNSITNWELNFVQGNRQGTLVLHTLMSYVLIKADLASLFDMQESVASYSLNRK